MTPSLRTVGTMNPLVALCCSFEGCEANRVDVITTIGRLKRMGFERLEDFDSADTAETLLGKTGAVADIINMMIAQATSDGDARRVLPCTYNIRIYKYFFSVYAFIAIHTSEKKSASYIVISMKMKDTFSLTAFKNIIIKRISTPCTCSQ